MRFLRSSHYAGIGRFNNHLESILQFNSPVIFQIVVRRFPRIVIVKEIRFSATEILRNSAVRISGTIAIRKTEAPVEVLVSLGTLTSFGQLCGTLFERHPTVANRAMIAVIGRRFQFDVVDQFG